MWATLESGLHPDSVSTPHNLGKFGLTYPRWLRLQRCFRLPTDPAVHDAHVDIFCLIRLFEREWNKAMCEVLILGTYINVDESMGMWRGNKERHNGMPRQMHMFRKPTSDGRESHTAACVANGVLIFTEMFEGAARMATKKFVAEWGKLPARALRCTEPWHRTGRVVILDAGFASVLATRGFAEQGLSMVGNVKGGHKDPKEMAARQGTKERERGLCGVRVHHQQWPAMGAASRGG
jgi:hypothetical protein